MNEEMHVDLSKCYALVDQLRLFEKVIEKQLTANELLNAFNTIEKKYDTPLLILYLNQIDHYACERILAAIADKLEDYFRHILNRSGLIIKSEQAQRLLFSITDKFSNREIIRFSLSEKKFAIHHTYPKNQAAYEAKKERYSKEFLQKEKYYSESIDYLKKWIRDYEDTPYEHFSEVKKTYKTLGIFAAAQTLFSKEQTFTKKNEQYQWNNRLLDVMVKRLADLLAEKNSFEQLESDFELIQNLRPGVNKSFIFHGYDEVDYKKMYKN